VVCHSSEEEGVGVTDIRRSGGKFTFMRGVEEPSSSSWLADGVDGGKKWTSSSLNWSIFWKGISESEGGMEKVSEV
jgi:hypothetical protein